MLSQLGLYVATTVGRMSWDSREGFAKLRSLNLGTSPAFPSAHLIQVQIYLSGICSEPVEICATRTRHHVELIWTGPQDLNVYKEREDFWDSVGAGVKMIQEEKAHLAQENAKLMKANADLMRRQGD